MQSLCPQQKDKPCLLARQIIALVRIMTAVIIIEILIMIIMTVIVAIVATVVIVVIIVIVIIIGRVVVVVVVVVVKIKLVVLVVMAVTPCWLTQEQTALRQLAELPPQQLHWLHRFLAHHPPIQCFQ